VDAVPGPQLDALEARSQRNQNLRPLSRVCRRREPQRASDAGSLSHISLGASAARARTSVSRPDFATGQEPTLTISICRRIYRTKSTSGVGTQHREVPRRQQAASAADLASLDLAVHAELATDYTLEEPGRRASMLEKTSRTIRGLCS